MNQPTDRTTAKVIIEGRPDIVEAITQTMQQVCIVTYQSKDQHVEANGHVRRTLRLRPTTGESQ